MLSPEELKILVVPDIEPVKAFVQKALQMKGKGDPANYNHIVQQLRMKDDLDLLWKVLIALDSCVSQITSRPDYYRDIINCVLNYDWSLEHKLTLAYVNVIGSIVSSNATYVVPAFQSIVKNLIPHSLPPALPTPIYRPLGVADSDIVACDREVLNAEGIASAKLILTEYEVQLKKKQKRIQKTLKGLIAMAPSGQASLYPLLCDQFPYKKQNQYFQTQYINQLLYICEYLPVYQYRILELIISKCLEIDVEIIIEDTGDVNVNSDQLLEEDGDEDIFSMDPCTAPAPSSSSNNNGRRNRVGSGGSVIVVSKSKHAIQLGGGKNVSLKTRAPNTLVSCASGKFHTEANQRIAEEVEDMAEKLDAMLVYVLRFIDVQLSKGEESADRIFHQMIGLFEEKILVIHRSKFVQFLLFYITSKVKKYCYLFIRRILQLFYNEIVAPNIRQSAIAYLASYISRATFVPQNYVSDAVEELIQWSDSYVHHADALTIEYESPPLNRSGSGLSTAPHASGFITCRRPLGADSFSPVKSGIGSGRCRTDSFASSSDRHDVHGDGLRTSRVVIPTSSHWVKMDGRTHRHRTQLINAPEDFKELVSKGIPIDGCPPSPVTSVLGKRQASSSLSSTAPPISKFIPNDSCGNLAELLSSAAVNSSPALHREDSSCNSNATTSAGYRLTDLQKHETFYVCVQAAAYISCFYGTRILLDSHMPNEVLRRQWECVLTSSLNPLKYCLSSVKCEFLRLLKSIQFLRQECWDMIAPHESPLTPSVSSNSFQQSLSQTNLNPSSNTSPSSLGSGGTSSGSLSSTTMMYQQPVLNKHNPLDSFFPFDPCLLHHMSSEFIPDHVLYRIWEGIPGLDFDDGNDEGEGVDGVYVGNRSLSFEYGPNSSSSSCGDEDEDVHVSAFISQDDNMSNSDVCSPSATSRSISGSQLHSQSGDDRRESCDRSMSVGWLGDDDDSSKDGDCDSDNESVAKSCTSMSVSWGNALSEKAHSKSRSKAKIFGNDHPINKKSMSGHYYDEELSNTSTSLLTDDEFHSGRRGSSISDIGDVGIINSGIKLSSGTYHQPYDDYLRIVGGGNTNTNPNTNNTNNTNSIKQNQNAAESKLNTYVSQENQNYSNIRRQRGISMGSNVSAGSW